MSNVYVHFSQISFPARYSVVNFQLESHSLRFREVIMIILSPQQGMIISNMIFSINYSVLIATFLYFIYPPIKEIPTIEHATAIGVDIYTIDAFFKIQYST